MARRIKTTLLVLKSVEYAPTIVLLLLLALALIKGDLVTPTGGTVNPRDACPA